jgi:5'-nucleotidase
MIHCRDALARDRGYAMKLLLTNDDGIDAPGLAALDEAARQLGSVVVVAPTDGHSGCGHRVTTDEGLAVLERSPGRLAVAGTPADCVRVALHSLAPDADWVLAGINAGGNLGVDVWHSGTVAAVREAVLHGKPGVALSHYRRRDRAFDWPRASAWTVSVLKDLLARPREPGTFWNVNLPNLEPGAPMPSVVFCPINPHPLPLSYRREGDNLHYNGNYHDRRRDAGTDVAVCFGGQIAVSLLRLF